MKNKKRLFHLLALSGLVVLLTACGSNEAITAESTGLWDRYIIYNLSQFIIWLSNLFGNNYAMGIIIFTVILRILMTPLIKMQYASQRKMQDLQPELDKLKAKYNNNDRESLVKMQAEQRELMAKNGVSMYASMLPLAIQLPIMMALYQAIVRTEVLRDGHFLWTNLGNPDPYFILPIVAAVLTYANSYLITKASPSKNPMLSVMNYLMPAMILLISIGLPTAVTLYWVISNALTVAQTMIFNNPYKIIEERQAKIQAEKAKQRELKKALKRATRRK